MSNLLKSERQVLIINDFTKLKFVFVDKDGEPIEEENRYSVNHVQNLINLLSAMIKNKIYPIKGDILDEGTDRMEIINRYFEMKNDILFIVYDVC
jgi:hypothetical protein